MKNAVRSAPGIHLVAGAGTLAGLAVATVRRLTPAEVAALWSLVTVATTLVTGYLQKSHQVAVTAAMVSTVIGDLAAFSIHVPPSCQGIGMAALSYLTGSVLHLHTRQAAVVNVSSAAVSTGPAPGSLTFELDNPDPKFRAN